MSSKESKDERMYDKDRHDSEVWHRRLLQSSAIEGNSSNIVLYGDASSADVRGLSKSPSLHHVPGSFIPETSHMETSSAYSLNNEFYTSNNLSALAAPEPVAKTRNSQNGSRQTTPINTRSMSVMHESALYAPTQEELEQITARYALPGSANSHSGSVHSEPRKDHQITPSLSSQGSESSVRHTLLNPNHKFSRAFDHAGPIKPLLTPSVPQVKLDPVNSRKDAHRHEHMTAAASTTQLANRLHVPPRVIARRRSIGTSQSQVISPEFSVHDISPSISRSGTERSRHSSIGAALTAINSERQDLLQQGTPSSIAQITAEDKDFEFPAIKKKPEISFVIRQPTVPISLSIKESQAGDEVSSFEQDIQSRADSIKEIRRASRQPSEEIAYCDFGPSIKERVETALFSALTRARQQVTSGKKYKITANTYQKMISEDLDTASSSLKDLLDDDFDVTILKKSSVKVESQDSVGGFERSMTTTNPRQVSLPVMLLESLRLSSRRPSQDSETLGMDLPLMVAPESSDDVVHDADSLPVLPSRTTANITQSKGSELSIVLNLSDREEKTDSLQSVDLTPMIERHEYLADDDVGTTPAWELKSKVKRQQDSDSHAQIIASTTDGRLERMPSLTHTVADTETSYHPEFGYEDSVIHSDPDDNTTQVSGNRLASIAYKNVVKKRTLSWLVDILANRDSEDLQDAGGQLDKHAFVRSHNSTAPARDQLEADRKNRPSINRQHSSAYGGLPQSSMQTSTTHNKLQVTETFVKTIEDLERLLFEALQIAHEAADRRDYQELPKLLASAAAVLKSHRQGDENSTQDLHLSLESGKTLPLNTLCNVLERSDILHEDLSNSANASVLEKDRTSHPISNCAVTEEPSVIRRRSSAVTRLLSTSLEETETPMTFGSPERRATFEAALQVSNKAKEIPDNYLPVPIRAVTKVYDQPALVQRVNSTLSNSGVAFMPDTRREVDITPLLPQTQEIESSMNIPHPGQRVSIASLPSLTKEDAPSTPIMARIDQLERAAIQKDELKSAMKKSDTIESKKVQYEEDSANVIVNPKVKKESGILPNKREVREFIRVFNQPPLHPRNSSYSLRKRPEYASLPVRDEAAANYVPVPTEVEDLSLNSIQTMDGFESDDHDVLEFSRSIDSIRQASVRCRNPLKKDIDGFELQDLRGKSKEVASTKKSSKYVSLKGKSHINIAHHKGFSLARHHKRAPLARDWSPFRKRFVAGVICISTAMIGILIGIYAGMVPSIQYYIADQNHTAILGNVFFYIGLAIPTFLAWPLPLLHGRKPYTLASLSMAMPLLFPQGIMVQQQRSPYVATYRVGLILPRAFMGIALGLAQMNFMNTMLDLFGASLMAVNPHQEVVDDYDVRRHGGGMGIWLGLWTWCYTGSIGIGFLIGCTIIDNQTPAWGFYVSIVIIAFVLVLNIITPEVRRSAFRRSVTEVRKQGQVERRLGRGEVMMHRTRTGPKWWAQEVHHGILLSLDMLRQPGFLVVMAYSAWTYGQITLIIVLLGSLMSKEYRFKSPQVGVCALAIPLGGLLAVPFTKASLFSRARDHAVRRDSATFEKQFTWTSHLVRRSVFTFILPLAGLAYTLSSEGPPTPFILPILFTALLSFLSNLAIAECNGLIMDTFDTSDLHPGMTGRSRKSTVSGDEGKRTNYSSFPRVAAAFSLTQGFGFLVAAVATGVGGVAQRHLGQRAATGVMEAFLFMFTMLLLGVLVRWKEVQIIPTAKTGDMERWEQARRDSLNQSAVRARTWNSTKVTGVLNAQAQAPIEAEEPWRPVIIGNPSGKTRRMNILEMGRLSRWSEIRRENRLIDAGSLEALHPERYIVQRVISRIEGHNAASNEPPKIIPRMSSGRGSKKSSKGQPLLAPDSSPAGEMEPDEDGDILPPMGGPSNQGSREPLRGRLRADGR